MLSEAHGAVAPHVATVILPPAVAAPATAPAGAGRSAAAAAAAVAAAAGGKQAAAGPRHVVLEVCMFRLISRPASSKRHEIHNRSAPHHPAFMT